MSHAFSRKVQARGVTVAEWVVLRELYDGDSMPSALAERLGLTRGAISKLADRLAALADENDEEFFGCLDAETRSAIQSAMRRLVQRHGLRGAPTV